MPACRLAKEGWMVPSSSSADAKDQAAAVSGITKMRNPKAPDVAQAVIVAGACKVRVQV